MSEMAEKILENRIAMFFICLVAAAGAVVAIAGGFRVLYSAITFIGN
jgi:hypothetical protein